ncbi:DUF1190 domain-containing protein [Pseudomonas fluorescens]|jgi:uncharacterized protein YgiB involved in biofilm formation|uniref:DUF1190 domain-containing protein n=1 Tax=Pseudomonas fluorescens TaxID=294 RepID=UPI000F49291C|nr:DUF1190 domain-containing protein [Pseudomonas fluorescens]RON83968.1 hypothetical protein BK668_24575 [Pseudomonas fluorescens]
MKRSKYVQLSLAASVAMAISGEATALDSQRFQTVEQCVDASVAADVCSNAYVAALTEHRRIAPAYDDKAKCDADFAADWCQKNSDGRFVPKLGGFKVPQNAEAPQDLNAIANAQMPAGDAAAAQNVQSTSHSSGGGNGWLSGWLIGNAMSNNANRTVYRDRDTRQTYNTSAQYRKTESAPATRTDTRYDSTRSKPVNVASSTSRGGFGSQSSARSGWGGWGSSSS